MLSQPFLNWKAGYSSIMNERCSETIWIFHYAMPMLRGFLVPIINTTLYWTKYSRLSKYLFLSSSYPKTQLLVPVQRELPF